MKLPEYIKDGLKASAPLLIFFVILMSITPFARESETSEKSNQGTAKVVAHKFTSTESSTGYKYDWWNGRMVMLPEIHTEYTVVFTDSSTRTVSGDQYQGIKVGDTLR